MTTSANVAIAFDFSDWQKYLLQGNSALTLDLSESTMIDVIRAYENFKRRNNKCFNRSNLISNIRAIQDLFGVTIMPRHIDQIFYSYWMEYLVKRGCKYSTIHCYFDEIRAILKWATRYKCPISDTFDLVNIPKYNSTKIALTPDQVSHIYHFDISKLRSKELPDRISKAAIGKVRDMFLLSCNLGQRYSDMVRITPDHFDETKTVLSIIQQKTSAKAVVDIKEFAIDPNVTFEILRRYDYHAPYTGNINTYNKVLHFLIRSIGGQFDNNVKTENKVNGKIEIILKPMHQMISSHTARRTFITNNILRGKPEIKVRRCSGHTDGRHFGTYCILD